jgi:hypothetical protein
MLAQITIRDRFQYLGCIVGTVLAAVLSTELATPASAADGWWLDDINTSYFLLTGRLDRELAEMRQLGATTLLLHSDVLPRPILEWVAYRARKHHLKTVAWIQWPSKQRLSSAAGLKGIAAVQVDDHFFQHPPISIPLLRHQLKGKQLWCSLQPAQLNWQNSQGCDHIDIQLYRLECDQAVKQALRLGLANQSETAVAIYHDGSKADTSTLACSREKLKAIGLSTFVFKWKNPEVYFKPLWQHPLSAKAMHWTTNWLQHFAAGLHVKRLSE